MQLAVGVEQWRLVEEQPQPGYRPAIHLRLPDVRAESSADEELQPPSGCRVADGHQVYLPVRHRGAGRHAESASETWTVRHDDGAKRKLRARRLVVDLD